MLRWCACLLLLSSSFAFSDVKASQERPEPKHTSTQLPLSTHSPRARAQFERAMRYFEEYRLTESLQSLRDAAKADPKFAQAFIMIAKISKDPAEQAAARQRAKQLSSAVTPGEQLLIRWLAGAQEDDYLPAIAAMNDLLSMYPYDHRLAFLAGDWLTLQARYEQAAVVLEHALTLLPDYPAALNDLGYTYAYSGEFDKAFVVMDRYVALEPNQPNPHDSYGEILRMDGKFEAALEQYRMSIRMDPNFGSELGVADTYAVMGKEQKAREEYARAIVFAGSQSDKVEYELQSAVTWIRENNRRQAEKALAEVVRHARASGLALPEAEADRVLAMCDPNLRSASQHLKLAWLALQDHADVSASDRDEERARILRVRATRLAEAEQIDSALQTVHQLQGLVGQSKSRVVLLCYHGAAGAVLMAQRKFAEAIPELEEDSAEPLSMRLLWKAYRNTGDSNQAQTMAATLSALNVPTVEQALVVPQFRASLISVSQAGRQ
jgi:tetratricopeptide (TPR) repeat protein